MREKILLIFLKKEFFRLKVMYLKQKKKKKQKKKTKEEIIEEFINNFISFIERKSEDKIMIYLANILIF